jgi:CheY-like chemotaxis protein
VQGSRFDLVLMDIEMPVLDGCRATQALRRLGMKLPILALTGHDTAQFRDEAMSCGFDEVLAKPVPKRVLLQACSRFLASRPAA